MQRFSFFLEPEFLNVEHERPLLLRKWNVRCLQVPNARI